jgi:hypothetical protein
MWQPEFLWFFTIFHHEFRKNHPIAFEVLMVLAVAHLFGFYNPKQLADFLEVPHQQFYTELKERSVYQVKKMLLRFMVKQAAEKLKPVISKSAANAQELGRPYLLTTVSWIDSANFYAVHGAGIVVAIIKSFEVKTYLVLCSPSII